jgi:hypothetical protein
MVSYTYLSAIKMNNNLYPIHPLPWNLDTIGSLKHFGITNNNYYI